MRFVGRKAAVVLAMSSALAACSSVDRDGNVASNGAQTPETAASEQVTVAGQAADGPAIQAGTDNTVTLVKTSRLPIPVPTATEATSVQTVAMASTTMAPFVVMQPSAPVAPQAATTSTLLASAPHTTGKAGRLVSPPVAAAVQAGQIQPAAAQAIALDEPELTPDMVALQSVIPTPRPAVPGMSATGMTTLAYAAQPKAVAAVSAIDNRMEFPPAPGEPMPETAADAPSDLKKLIHRYAGLYGVPESLVHRVVHRESKYDPKAYHKNGYWGLMQIKYSTAKSMGYDGPPEGLLDAETNLKYAIKYLRGAWLVADNQNDNAIRLYARGYYYDAKRKDMLHVLQK
ncbi:lytic transglycosylase domain-containing protein [Rhizobium sp. NFR07]|uniref:lytic transglycosylase domain-containing protein n=1 Tax=Rhizobium sp. NFR07 TaxID=1566262 RepID=UPI000B899C1B|nr:lytic transglycosylase domain-containing protein [Rhizobium sp. NFR07]